MSIIDKQVVSGRMTMGGKRGTDCMHLIIDIPVNQFRDYPEFISDSGDTIPAGSSMKIGTEKQRVPVTIDGVNYMVHISIGKAGENSRRIPVSDVL